MSAASPSTGPAALLPGKRAALPQQTILVALLIAEIVIFSVSGTNFFTVANFSDVTRHNVELGLLALALTPVIVTGGIDLSVGSLLGLCAVLFGKLWRDAHLPAWEAAAGAIAIGAAGGAINGLIITRLRIPPLIVTLGTFSLFRGIAEGITGGVDNFTNFPKSFLFLGNGHILGLPVQLYIFAVAAVLFWIFLHRTIVGRALSAIGYSEEGARYAGLPVERRIGLAYVLSGLCAGLGAVIYAARVGQAKADAGTGYELLAITAVVLGGTSIFGGRGSIIGSLLGLFAIGILQSGLRLSGQPPELAGVLTGGLLIAAICLDWTRLPAKSAAPARAAQSTSEEFEMKNTQLAVLCAVILAAALIVAGGNYMLVNSVQRDAGTRASSGGGSPTGGAASGTEPKPAKQITVAMMPKSKGNAYFIACRKGAEEAAKELGVNLLWDGPTDPDPARQNEIVESWITRGVDVISVAVENRQGLSTALRKARQAGIKVITWDADAEPDARDYFVNQATPQGIGSTLMDDAAQVMGNKGDFAIITASLTAANMNEWQKWIEARRVEKYPDIKMVALRPCDDIQKKAFDETNNILNSQPNVKLIMAICSPAVPGAAEAVKQSGRSDVKVVGLGLPNDNKPYVHAGITPDVILWNTMDLGYLAVVASVDIKNGTLKPGDKSMKAGKLGKIDLDGSVILLGKPFTFTKDNIDQFDF